MNALFAFFATVEKNPLVHYLVIHAYLTTLLPGCVKEL